MKVNFKLYSTIKVLKHYYHYHVFNGVSLDEKLLLLEEEDLQRLQNSNSNKKKEQVLLHFIRIRHYFIISRTRQNET